MDPPAIFGSSAPMQVLGVSVDPMIWSLIVVAVVSCAAASAAILVLGHRLRRARISELSILSRGLADGSVFVFSDRRLFQATDDARAFLKRVRDGKSVWQRLAAHFSAASADIAAEMEHLAATGTGFRRDMRQDDGTYVQVEGAPRGGMVEIRVRDLSTEHEARLALEEKLNAVSAEKILIDAVVDAAPLLVWSRDADRTLNWANARMRQIATEAGDAEVLPEAFVPDNDTDPSAVKTHRARLAGGGPEAWYDVREISGGEGRRIGFATDVGDLVEAEGTLQRFIATLTETFAHLPVGLAIFDRDRALTLFNPSLTDMMSLDPVWLARRPTMREFLEKLREARLMPEQKTFDDWRRHVQVIEASAVEGELREKWVLPSGRTFEVTGRPHPHGAIALLFEDITATTTLEQRYRSEIELSQTTLDRLKEAVAVFDTSGSLVFANAAFTAMWGFDPMASLEPMNVLQVTGRWSEASNPNPAWGDLREFATRSEDRAPWDTTVDMRDGRRLHAGFSPLPDGSTLAVFSDISDEARHNTGHARRLRRTEEALSGRAAVLDLTVDRLRASVDHVSGALDALAAAGANGAAVNGAAANGAAARADWKAELRAALRQTQDILALETPRLSTTAPRLGPFTRDLANLAATRGLTLDITLEEGLAGMEPQDDVRRLLLNVVLVATDLMRPGDGAALSILEDDGALRIGCTGRRGNVAADLRSLEQRLPCRLLTRLSQKMGGALILDTAQASDQLKIAVTVPAAHTAAGGALPQADAAAS